MGIQKRNERYFVDAKFTLSIKNSVVPHIRKLFAKIPLGTGPGRPASRVSVQTMQLLGRLFFEVRGGEVDYFSQSIKYNGSQKPNT